MTYRGMLPLIVGAAVSAGAQTTYYVAPNGLDTRTGTNSWTNAVATISNAVQLAASGSTILVSNGVYLLSSNVAISKYLRVRSWNNGDLDPTNTILDGQRITRCLYMNLSTALVAGFTMRNGNGVGDQSAAGGGAVYITAGQVSNCVAISNRATASGGGIHASGVNSLVTHCQVLANVLDDGVGTNAMRGGGVYLENGGVLRDSTLAFNTNINTAAYEGGGGVYIRLSSSTGTSTGQVVRCTIVSNVANSGGGVLGYRRCHIISNTIVGNQAVYANVYSRGGGAFLSTTFSGSVFVANTVSGNQSCAAGGGLYLSPDSGNVGGILVSNCLVVDNVTTTAGGGICVAIFSGSYLNSKIVVADSTIAGNEARAVSATYGQSGYGGGGIFWEAPGLLVNCTVADNRSWATGGGLRLQRAYVTLPEEELVVRNCLVAGNDAQYAGGVFVGQANADRAIRLESCTIAGNTATNYGGGLAITGLYASITNSIVYANVAPANANIRTNTTIYAIGYTCTEPTNHLSLGGALTAVITNDPAFRDAGGGDFRPADGSSCLDIGLNQAWMDTALDLAGLPRIDPLMRRVDLGAYETRHAVTLFGAR